MAQEIRLIHARRILCVATLVLGTTGSISCLDPLHANQVSALGEEKRGVRPGPNHRPGQDCLVCHGGDGPASPDFSVAGTIYSARAVLEPLAGASVVLMDAKGSTRSAVTNEVGNFYIAADSWSPTYPLFVELDDPRADEGGVKKMVTRIGRYGGCAFCHYGNDDEPTHMPPVFLRRKAL